MINRNAKLLSLGLFFCLIFQCWIPLYAADEDRDYSGVTSHGVIYNVAEDRKIQKVGAVVQPEGLDIYLKRHLDNLSVQIKSLESKVENMQKDIQEMHESLLGKSPENLEALKK